MNLKPFPLWGVIGTFAVCGPLVFSDRSYAAPPESVPTPASEDAKDVEVLTHGPVHEAFAATVNYNPKPGLIVKKAPPAVIEERPPDQRPEGDNVAWIPGYWAWEEESSDFIWISGIWRNLPPDRQWVPGYWNPVGDEYQWVSGYWSDTSEKVTDYLPEPPESLERGPSAEASSRDEVWTPGYWDWRDDRYAWTPGYWVAPRTNWVWIPAHYVWTPRGYVFVRGYWDYAVPRRGVLFAPVYFHDDYYRRPGYYYSPSTVISLTLFLDHLFLRPRYSHYYFGDYYASRYRDSGFYPSYAFYSSRMGYDPIFSYRRWEHRGDRDWLRSREREFISLRDNEALRPARTFAALRAKGDRGDALALAAPLEQVARSEKSEMRFRKLSDSQREEIVSRRQEIRKFAEARKAEETSAKLEGGKREKAERVELAASPIRGRAASKFSKEEAPPATPASRGEAQSGKVPGENAGRRDEAPGPRDTSPSRRDEAPGAREPGDTGKRSDEAPGRREVSPSRRDEAPGAKDKEPDGGRSSEAPGRREVVPSRKDEAPGAREPGDTGKRSDEAPARREVTPSRKEEAPRAPERIAPEKTRRVEPEQTTRPERPAAKPQPEQRVQPERRPQPEQKVQPERREAPKAEPRTQPSGRESQGTRKKDEDKDKKNE